MNPVARLVTFAIVLVVVFALGFGLGHAVGPLDGASTPSPTSHQMEHDE